MPTPLSVRMPRRDPHETPNRSARFLGDRRIEMEDAHLPIPAGTQVRIRLEGCGVCASNLPVWEGRPWFEYPFAIGAPGHEGWGVIDELGSDVKGLSVGDRVACLSYHAFADYDVTEASHVIPLPPEMDGKPFPGEPLGCAFNVFDRCDIQSGQTVAIIGIGFLGAILTALAKQAGTRVLAISRRPFAREIALEMGADEVIPFESVADAEHHVHELTDSDCCQRVIEATGAQKSLTLAEQITGIRGRMIIAGYHQDGNRVVNMQQWNWRGIDVINAHERDPMTYMQGMRKALDAVVRGDIDPMPLFTHSLPLTEINDAMKLTSERPAGFMKALVINNGK